MSVRSKEPTRRDADPSSTETLVEVIGAHESGPQSGASGSGIATRKRKAATEEQPVQESTIRPVSGVRMTGLSTESRLLAVIKDLGRRHRLMMEDRAVEFAMHHEGRLIGDPLSLYTLSAPTNERMELDQQIESLEAEIHYSLDLYHTSRESRGLGAGELPVPRGASWYDRLAQERFVKRRKAE
jgi:hypothetical protein